MFKLFDTIAKSTIGAISALLSGKSNGPYGDIQNFEKSFLSVTYTVLVGYTSLAYSI